MREPIRVFHTVKYLRFRQVFFRVYYLVKNKFFPGNIERFVPGNPAVYKGLLNNEYNFIPGQRSWQGPLKFSFLNLEHEFDGEINWNFTGHKKLWTYNLNYFDFLLQSDMDKETGLSLIHDYCKKINEIKDGLEPYPVSLRCINWIKFILKHNIHDEETDKYLWAQIMHLSRNLEYHLMGNHLLENAFALFIASVYFNNKNLSRKANKLLLDELNEQILDDGAHFELSPMYHQIMLGRLLDCCNIAGDSKKSPDFTVRLENIASGMLGWLEKISFKDGSVPLVNDSANGIAPTTRQLLDYGKKINILPSPIILNPSGYRKFSNENYECLADLGNIGPDYQPGHAHADTFSFVLYFRGNPFLIDTGTSTYEPGEKRSLERSTGAHNTVTVDGQDSSQVWASHRVAKRAKVKILEDTETGIVAAHDGFRSKGITHQREFTFNEDIVTITDTLNASSENLRETTAHFHFAPGIIPEITEQKVSFGNGITIGFSHAERITVMDYMFAPEFNKTIPAKKLKITFSTSLKTTIYFENTVSH